MVAIGSVGEGVFTGLTRGFFFVRPSSDGTLITSVACAVPATKSSGKTTALVVAGLAGLDGAHSGGLKMFSGAVFSSQFSNMAWSKLGKSWLTMSIIQSGGFPPGLPLGNWTSLGKRPNHDTMRLLVLSVGGPRISSILVTRGPMMGVFPSVR